MNVIKTGAGILLSVLLVIPQTVAASNETLNTTDSSELKSGTASLSGDFTDDSVLVMYSRDSSHDLSTITKQDFPEIEAEAVTELSSGTKERIRNKRNIVKQEMDEVVALESKLDMTQMRRLSQTAAISDSHAAMESNIAARVSELKQLEDQFNQCVEIKLKTKGKQQVLNAINELEKREDILIVQPNYTYSLCSAPNDEYYSDQWAAKQINLEKAWDITTGSSDVVVGVMDSGIDRTHSDLAGRINIPLSRDFTGQNQPFLDGSNHGTSVAGIIGAVGNNSNYVSGVCWNIKMASLRISDNDGVTSSSKMINAIDHCRANDIFLVNISAGGSPENEDSMLENNINNFNGLVVCAAGNSNWNNDVTPCTPASLDCTNIISVGGSDRNDRPANTSGFTSNYGKKSVDLFAPAVDITTICRYNTSTDDFFGTSAAAPFVTGVAALIKSKYPDLTASRIKTYILNGVDKNSSLTSKCVSGGRLNAYNALKTTINYFTVSYNANGGSGTMTDTRVYYGESTATRRNTFTRAGYDFDCWYIYYAADNTWRYRNPSNTSQTGWYKEGSQPSGWVKMPYANGTSVSTTTAHAGGVITFYAQWKKYFTVAYNANGGSGSMPSTKVYYGVNTATSKNTFTRPGYTFDCWYIYFAADNAWRFRNPSNTSQTGWYKEGSQPAGWVKMPYSNGTSVSATTAHAGGVITFYAQWKKT